MVIEGNFTANVSLRQAWDFCNNMENIANLIPGCTSVTLISEKETRVVVEQKVGFLKGKFTVDIRLEDVVEMETLVAIGEGKDPLIGSSLKMNVAMKFEELAPEQVKIHYNLEVSVFGKLGTLGFFIIKGKAAEMEKEFVETATKELESLKRGE